MRVNLPGCGLPIDHEPRKSTGRRFSTNGAGNQLFVNALTGYDLKLGERAP